MTNRRGVIFRILADLFVAFSVTLAFFAVSDSGKAAWLIGVIGALLFAAGMAGYLEPSAKKVWIHPLVIMWPELIALPVAFLGCHGHGCAGVISFLNAANMFTLLLLGLSFAVFYVRRRLARSSGRKRLAA
jgi:hypothetical protein